MSRYFVQPLDPVEISSRFSTDKSFEPLPEMDEKWKGERLDQIQDVLEYLPEIEADYIRLYYFRDKKQVDIAKIFDVTQAAVSYRIKRGEERLRFILDMPDLNKYEVYDYLKEDMSDQNAKIFQEMYQTSCQTEVADRLDLGQGCVRHRFLNNLRDLGNNLIERFESFLDENDEKTRPSDLDHVDTELSRLNGQKGDMEDEDFENRLFKIIDVLEALEDNEEEEIEMDDVLDYASIYRVFVRIRYNFNILREVELPKWSSDPPRKVS